MRHNLVIILLRTTLTPRTLLSRDQIRAINFSFVRKLTSKAQVTAQEEKKSEEVIEKSQLARAKVSAYLEKSGVRVQRVRRQIDLRKLTVEKISRVFKILDDIGIDRNQRHKIISNRPTILITKDDLLRHRVKIMRSVGIYPESVAYVVKESPGVLTARIEESLPDKVKFFEELNVKPKFTKDEILHVLTKCPTIIAAYTVESLQKRVQLLEEELKFNKHHIKNIILKQPSVLTFSNDALREKWNYCYETMNVSPTCIARCPRVFQCSLKRIKERHLYLKHLGLIKDEMIIDDYGLGLIVTTSDKRFAEKVAKMSLDEFDEFRDELDLSNEQNEE